MFTEKDKENRERLCDIRERIINLLVEEGVEDRVEATRILASTLNEIMAPYGYNAAATLRPLIFAEDDDKK